MIGKYQFLKHLWFTNMSKYMLNVASMRKYFVNKLDTDAERHKEHGSGRGRSKGEADLLANNELMVGAKMRGPPIPEQE